MNMQCAKCGGPISRQPGPGGRRKFCEACSPRRDRPERRRPARQAAATPLSSGEEVNGVYAATVAELDTLGLDEGHWLRVLALNLAWHIDNSNASASGLVALVKEHRATLAACAAAAPKPDDALTRLRRERLDQQEAPKPEDTLTRLRRAGLDQQGAS